MEQRILVDSLDTARFTCPECHQEKFMQLSEYSIHRQTTKVKCRCKCGHTHFAILEKTPEPIQHTHLSGTFISNNRVQCNGKMIIKKLNRRGLVFKTNTGQDMPPGLKIFIEFVLDDAKQSIVKKEVVVKAKKGRYFSAEFTSNHHHDNLGPYLFSHNLHTEA